jgi:hypothetical protein
LSNPSVFKQYLSVVALAGLLFLLNGAIVSTALAASQTVTDKPISGKTTTVPAGKVLPGETTKTVPLPSGAPAREYQQVDKPPVKKLDIPEYDIAGRLADLHFERHNLLTLIIFSIELKNNGKQRIRRESPIPVQSRLINTANNSLIEKFTVAVTSPSKDLDSQYWVRMTPQVKAQVAFGRGNAPENLNDLKLIVDIDPDNTFKEAQRHRGNNRCVASW